jgi:hypothetical protein
MLFCLKPFREVFVTSRDYWRPRARTSNLPSASLSTFQPEPLIFLQLHRDKFNMCRFNWHFPGDDGPGCPLAQPLPQIEWAVPVDMTRLGASLEAYSRLETSITTLRLCHRFCQAPLSKLPQELLEHIIDEAHQAEIQETLEDWVSNQERECFQGLCKPEDHYEPYGPHTERVWQSLFGARDDEAVRDPTTYSEKEKVDMVVGFLSDSPTIHYDLDGWELHELRAAAWLDRVCTCASGAFRPLNDVSQYLKTPDYY